MKFLKQSITDAFKFFNEKLKKIILITAIMFLICLLSGIVFGIKNQEIANSILGSFVNSKSDLIADDGSISAIGLIKNNFVACIISVITGSFPFMFFPIFSLLMNGILVGVTLGFVKAVAGKSIIKSFLCGILPHGIFEIPALIISMAMGIYLCLFISSKIIGKNKYKFSELLKNYIIILCIVIFPLVVIAGFVEAYITPILINI